MTTQHITNLICTYLINIGVLPAIHPGHTTLLATRIAQHHKPPTAITIAEMIIMAKQALADHNPEHTPLPEAKKNAANSHRQMEKHQPKNGINTKPISRKNSR